MIFTMKYIFETKQERITASYQPPHCHSHSLICICPLQRAFFNYSGCSYNIWYVYDNELSTWTWTKVVRRKDNPDSGKPGCAKSSCMYGRGQGAVDHDFIYVFWSGSNINMCQMPFKWGNMRTWTWSIGACNMNNAYNILMNYHHFVTLYPVSLARGDPLPFLDTGMKNGFFILFSMFFFNWYGIMCMLPCVPWTPAIKHYHSNTCFLQKLIEVV